MIYRSIFTDWETQTYVTNTNQVLVVHRGTASMSDIFTDLAYSSTGYCSSSSSYVATVNIYVEHYISLIIKNLILQSSKIARALRANTVAHLPHTQ